MEQGIEVTLQSNGGSQIVLGLMLLSEVGQGGFGVVFGARADRHLNPNFPAVPDEHPSVTDVFALKVSKQPPGKVHAFQSEADAYALMAAKLDLSVPAGVPCFYGLGTLTTQSAELQLAIHGKPVRAAATSHDCLLMQLLGRSVHGYMLQLGACSPDLGAVPRIPMPHAVFRQLARSMLSALQALHEHGLVHRDVKPDNFCLQGEGHSVCVIDFGFAAPLPIQGSPYRSHAAYVGTPDYASLSALGQRQQGCADDCEALAYTLLEMWQGHLPWDMTHLAPGHCWDAAHVAAMHRARTESWQELCEARALPRWCVHWVHYCHTLANCDVPNYDYLRQLIDHSAIEGALRVLKPLQMVACVTRHQPAPSALPRALLLGRSTAACSAHASVALVRGFGPPQRLGQQQQSPDSSSHHQAVQPLAKTLKTAMAQEQGLERHGYMQGALDHELTSTSACSHMAAPEDGPRRPCEPCMATMHGNNLHSASAASSGNLALPLSISPGRNMPLGRNQRPESEDPSLHRLESPGTNRPAKRQRRSLCAYRRCTPLPVGLSAQLSLEPGSGSSLLSARYMDGCDSRHATANADSVEDEPGLLSLAQLDTHWEAEPCADVHAAALTSRGSSQPEQHLCQQHGANTDGPPMHNQYDTQHGHPMNDHYNDDASVHGIAAASLIELDMKACGQPDTLTSSSHTDSGSIAARWRRRQQLGLGRLLATRKQSILKHQRDSGGSEYQDTAAARVLSAGMGWAPKAAGTDHQTHSRQGWQACDMSIYDDEGDADDSMDLASAYFGYA